MRIQGCGVKEKFIYSPQAADYKVPKGMHPVHDIALSAPKVSVGMFDGLSAHPPARKS